jgi:hypothetical protein
MARKQKLTDEQLEQRRKACVAGAAKPHDPLCGCPQCYYKARRGALEGQGESQVTFPIYAAWRGAQELERAARDQVARDAAQAVEDTRVVDNVRAGDAGGDVVGEEYMPPQPGTRVVTELGTGARVFIAPDAGALNGSAAQQVPEQTPDIITFTTSPGFLGLDISVPQRTLLKVSYGLELDEEEMGHFRQCTGRTIDPRTAFSTVVVIAGARAGKDSRLVGPVALYETVFGSHKLSKGETGTIGLYAQGTTAAGVTFGYISKYATESPRISELVRGDALRSSIALDTATGPFTIRTFPATRIAGRAYSFPVAVLNESAFYRFEGAANADTEILTSVRRGMLNFPRRKLLIVSTPYAKQGILYDHFVKFYGRDDSKDVLVWRAPTTYMNPSISAERLEEERRVMDPSHFAREYLAEFIDDAAAWLPSELIEQAVDIGITERPSFPGIKYTMAIDASGAGACAFAVSIGHVEDQGDGTIVIVQDVLRSFTKPRSGKLNLKGVVREIIGLAAAYNHIEVAYSDRYAGQWPLQAFEEEAAALSLRFTLQDPTLMRGQDNVRLTKSDAFRKTAPLFRTARIRLVDSPSQVRELRNLEARPTENGIKIGKPLVRGELDDQANAMAAMASMLSIKRKPGGFVKGVAIMNKDYTQASRGRVRADGYIESSGGHFVSKSGERYFDPRYS